MATKINYYKRSFVASAISCIATYVICLLLALKKNPQGLSADGHYNVYAIFGLFSVSVLIFTLMFNVLSAILPGSSKVKHGVPALIVFAFAGIFSLFNKELSFLFLAVGAVNFLANAYFYFQDTKSETSL